MIVTAHRRRTSKHQISIYDADNNLVSIGAGDKVRVKIGYTNSTPILDIVSGTPTDNGTTLTAANPSTLRLDQDDLEFEPGAYSIEVSVVDAADGNDIKHAQTGVFILHDTPSGDVT